MSDYNLWKNDIENRFSPTSLTNAADGDGFVATAIISSVTTNSSRKLSLLDAYKDLQQILLNGIEVLPMSTTTQRDALSNIVDGEPIYNKSTGRMEICQNSAWIPAGGTENVVSAFGEMVEDNDTGSTINTTTKLWDSASVGLLDSNGNVTFSGSTTGDKLVIVYPTSYQVHFSCTFTNEGGNEVSAGIRVNGVEVAKLLDTHESDSSKKNDLRGQGLLNLVLDDEIALHVVSSTPGDAVKVYHCHVTAVAI